MCGIIGYVGYRKASEVVLKALKTLEYRGYDSAGIAVQKDSGITVRKDAGRIAEVAEKNSFISLEGDMGIGHTRWATHGKVCRENAHPHTDCSGKIALIHNGVIENYLELRESLISKGHKFVSETDTEAIAHLIEENMKTADFETSFRKAVNSIRGSFAIVAMNAGSSTLAAARRNSPLILGVGEGENFLASDIPAVLPYTKKVVPIDDDRIIFVSKTGFKISDLSGKAKRPQITQVDWSAEDGEKGGFAHFMLKEIHEQKDALHQALSAEVEEARAMIRKARNIHIIACGTSYHAGIILSILIERNMGAIAKPFIASEYPFTSNPGRGTLAIAITQSGETADTMQAVKFAKSKGAKILSLTNVVGSSITRISDSVVYLNAGPEISVAATKTFSSQLAVICKLALGEAPEAPQIIGRAIENGEKMKEVAEKLKGKEHIFFLGRGLSYPIAMEGALKLKELSYLHAEAYPGGELKHGPLSLIQEGVPVIALAPSDESLPKIHGNIKEVKARGAFVIALTDSPEISREVDMAIQIEKTRREFYPFAMLPALQLLAYYTSVSRGIDPDRPRNLAKSVTVE